MVEIVVGGMFEGLGMQEGTSGGKGRRSDKCGYSGASGGLKLRHLVRVLACYWREEEKTNLKSTLPHPSQSNVMGTSG